MQLCQQHHYKVYNGFRTQQQRWSWTCRNHSFLSLISKLPKYSLLSSNLISLKMWVVRDTGSVIIYGGIWDRLEWTREIPSNYLAWIGPIFYFWKLYSEIWENISSSTWTLFSSFIYLLFKESELVIFLFSVSVSNATHLIVNWLPFKDSTLNFWFPRFKTLTGWLPSAGCQVFRNGKRIRIGYHLMCFSLFRNRSLT